ncbi:hypothetical protein LJC36_00265 [Desulfovibrio sp. OttesenSCG-928-C14]|nr:hypothetical protein [Desulfovibrio sp. OttesenSCG-928-C14]
MITSYTAQPTQDVVAVLDGYTQVFRAARPIKASVRDEAKLMEHPQESGGTVTDHEVFQPVAIELMLILQPENYRDTYREIKTLYRQGKILTVQTKADSYRNQVIEAIPHEEDPDKFDTIPLTLKLKEITIVTAQFQAVYKPKNQAQSDTSDRGEVQPEESQGSWASKNIKYGRG